MRVPRRGLAASIAGHTATGNRRRSKFQRSPLRCKGLVVHGPSESLLSHLIPKRTSASQRGTPGTLRVAGTVRSSLVHGSRAQASSKSSRDNVEIIKMIRSEEAMLGISNCDVAQARHLIHIFRATIGPERTCRDAKFGRLQPLTLPTLRGVTGSADLREFAVQRVHREPSTRVSPALRHSTLARRQMT